MLHWKGQTEGAILYVLLFPFSRPARVSTDSFRFTAYYQVLGMGQVGEHGNEAGEEGAGMRQGEESAGMRQGRRARE